MNERNNTSIVLALPKGRIFSRAVDFLASAGIAFNQQEIADRRLMIATNQSNLSVTIVRNIDTPVYTALGVADAAILGRDSIAEDDNTGEFYDLLDLGIAHCRLMTAARKGYVRTGRRIRVATKFVNTARSYYSNLGIQADIIKLYGSVELAVAINLADEIVDLVETGKTLEENDLEPMETIMDISSHLVINTNAMITKHQAIMQLTRQLESAVT